MTSLTCDTASEYIGNARLPYTATSTNNQRLAGSTAIATVADTTAPAETSRITRLRGTRSDRYPSGYWVAAAPKIEAAMNTPTRPGSIPVSYTHLTLPT